jgi:hypothetical protein
MKTKSCTILLAAIIIVIAVGCTAGSAGRPVPPSNETSKLSVMVDASVVGRLNSNTELTATQGNGNLSDNPPLSDGESQATIGYYEDTMATSGVINYAKDLSLDTSGKDTGNNLKVVRSIDYNSSADGNAAGRLYSSEEVVVEDCASSSSSNDTAGCCGLATATAGASPASCVSVIAGSEVDLKEGSVDSTSTARTISDSPDSGIKLGYSVDVAGSGNATAAVGEATVYTQANIQEGSGSGTNKTTDVSYDESVSVDGLINIAMNTVYSSS